MKINKYINKVVSRQLSKQSSCLIINLQRKTGGNINLLMNLELWLFLSPVFLSMTSEFMLNTLTHTHIHTYIYKNIYNFYSRHIFKQQNELCQRNSYHLLPPLMKQQRILGLICISHIKQKQGTCIGKH